VLKSYKKDHMRRVYLMNGAHSCGGRENSVWVAQRVKGRKSGKSNTNKEGSKREPAPKRVDETGKWRGEWLCQGPATGEREGKKERMFAQSKLKDFQEIVKDIQDAAAELRADPIIESPKKEAGDAEGESGTGGGESQWGGGGVHQIVPGKEVFIGKN